MFDQVYLEYFFDKALKYSIISDMKFDAIDRETSMIGIEVLAEQAEATQEKSEIYWEAYCGRTKPAKLVRKRYHNPPRFIY